MTKKRRIFFVDDQRKTVLPKNDQKETYFFSSTINVKQLVNIRPTIDKIMTSNIGRLSTIDQKT